MRRLAQQPSGCGWWQDLLRSAIDNTLEGVQAATGGQRMRFDLEPYLREASTSLQSVAKEICRLSGKLRESRTAKRVYDKARLTEETGEAEDDLSFEIRELGLLDSIEGLLAIPVDDSGTINIDAIKEDYEVMGDWFPYEVIFGESVYVVDDDGTVFVSTENFPREYLERVRETLAGIASRLYS